MYDAIVRAFGASQSMRAPRWCAEGYRIDPVVLDSIENNRVIVDIACRA
jgi:hypothetical protein